MTNSVFRDENGTSIVEVMIAIVVFLIIMVGGLNYFLQPQSAIVRQKIKRLAISATQTRMETLLALDFTQITSDSNETNTAVSLGAINGLRTTTVTTVDDAADGLGGSDADNDTVDYKTVFVKLTWDAGRSQEVSFTTNVSDIAYKGSESQEGGGGGSLALVSGSQEVYGGDCHKIKFSVQNNTGSDIQITSLQLDWASPTAYYNKIKWDGGTVFNSSSPRSGSGDVSNFSSTKTITNGSEIEIEIRDFKENQSGGGGEKIDVSETIFTVLFSDNSTFNIAFGECDD